MQAVPLHYSLTVNGRSNVPTYFSAVPLRHHEQR